MPGLLDLPPELIEHIHFALERLIEAEHENGVGVAEELGRSRLTCRYFEHAPRRGYVEKNFVVWMVKAPDDENIQRFCAMASTPGLAVAIRKLHLSFGDDYTMEVAKADQCPKPLSTNDVATSLQDLDSQLEDKHSTQTQEENSPVLPEVKVTHAYDNRSCSRGLPENVTELWVGNKALEPERTHHYKRSHGWNRDGAPEPPEYDDDEQDPDGSEDEDDDASDEEDIEGTDVAEKDGEDHDWEDGDVDVQNQGSAAHAEGRTNDLDETTEHIKDHRDILFDVTLSLNYVLHLAAEAGMRPKAIGPFYRPFKTVPARVCTGLTDCAGLSKSKAALERLATLGLNFVRHHGLRLGKQISEVLLHMPALQRLAVNFRLELVNIISAWSILAKAPVIPTLKELNLDRCIMKMGDFTSFIGKHCSTWTSLTFSHLHLCKGAKGELGDLYERLSWAPSIEFHRQRYF